MVCSSNLPTISPSEPPYQNSSRYQITKYYRFSETLIIINTSYEIIYIYIYTKYTSNTNFLKHPVEQIYCYFCLLVKSNHSDVFILPNHVSSSTYVFFFVFLSDHSIIGQSVLVAKSNNLLK